MREFDLLRHVYGRNVSLGDQVEIPPGDDLAMIRLSRGAKLLAGVDQLVAGRHVNLDLTPIELVGRKAITRCLSDIAAMAARPVATLVAVTLPPDFGEDRAEALFNSMHETANDYHSPLIGGDIAFHGDPSHPLVCSVTVLAEPSNGGPVERRGALPGDRIYVTGELGASIDEKGLGHHLTFEPRIDLAIALLGALGDRLHAMIDISDGLGRDASHIAHASNVRIILDERALPCRAGADVARALADGEDYELCFAATGDVPREIAGIRVTPVGQVRELAASEPPGAFIERDGELVNVASLGWEHRA